MKYKSLSPPSFERSISRKGLYQIIIKDVNSNNNVLNKVNDIIVRNKEIIINNAFALADKKLLMSEIVEGYFGGEQ